MVVSLSPEAFLCAGTSSSLEAPQADYIFNDITLIHI